MKSSVILFLLAVISISSTTFGQHEIHKLDNLMSVEYLKKNLSKEHPRLVYTPEIVIELRKKLETDPVLINMYSVIKANAESVLEQPMLTRNIVGRRLLATSNELLWRVNMLGFVYLMEKDPKMLQRLDEELKAVCSFKDWNPSHFLDVAEMSMGVALAYDWTAGDLPQTTQDLIVKSLIVKGLINGHSEKTGWSHRNNNWNQVCNGGMVAAAITVAEVDPILSSKVIYRAIDGLPHALSEYGPDGSYPEGTSYWGYGTQYTVMTAAMFESAFGYDFGIAEYPAFLESAVFRVLSTAPSGQYYNYADCRDTRNENGDEVLAWFAYKTGNKAFFEKERFLQPVEEMSKLSRTSGAAMYWISQYEEKESMSMPKAWKGDGINPIVLFNNGEGDPNHYYFGGKGGQPDISHGNMDAGSFIFEINKVRWVIDPGKQKYHDLEKIGFDLWKDCQECDRWKLLTKNNFGHSTISVNNQLHQASSFAPLVSFISGDQPEAVFDLTEAFGGSVENVTRRFLKDSNTSITIEDDITVNDSTELIIWQLLTTADVKLVEDGVILMMDGKELQVTNLSHPEFAFSVISLYPTVYKLDKQMEGLKRLEIRIPAWTIETGTTKLRVRLSGD